MICKLELSSGEFFKGKMGDYVYCSLYNDNSDFNNSRFNTQKGFGFIDPDGDGPDVFVHQTDIKADGFRSLADGENVEYVPQEDAQGRLKATKVTGPGGENVQGAPYENPGSYDDGY